VTASLSVSLLLGTRRAVCGSTERELFSFSGGCSSRHGIPHRSLVALGLVLGVLLFQPAAVITMLVVTRILLQFFLQHVG